MRHWLMKSEPDLYSIDDLKRDIKTGWEGVRNYQARNFMWHDMKEGDRVLFYHSNAQPPGVAGIAEVTGKPRPDPTQFDKKSEYFDAASKKDDPRWWLVDIRFVEKLPQYVPLDALRDDSKLEGMLVLKRGMRLSVQPVEDKHFAHVLKLGASRLRS